MSGALHGGVTYIADGVALVREEYNSRNALERKHKMYLTTGQWDNLWQEIDRMGLAGWKREYSVAELGLSVTCSPRWGLELRRDGRLTKSGGDDAYPDLHNPSHTTEKRDSLDRLLHIFQQYLDEA